MKEKIRHHSSKYSLQRLLTALAGTLSETRLPWLKNLLIRYFVRRYRVNLAEAHTQTIADYETFNSFFTRALKPGARAIDTATDTIVCPVDGAVSQLGTIQGNTLFQAKGFYFSLQDLLADTPNPDAFTHGHFATLYLSPKDYHRVHMPFTGKLRETIFVPGKLFSVGPKTVSKVPNIFARNERLICIFETDIGDMAVILVGAMLVGSIATIWKERIRGDKIIVETFAHEHQSLVFQRGEEFAHFKMGSTVILLFARDKMQWQPDVVANSHVKMGQVLGKTVLP